MATQEQDFLNMSDEEWLNSAPQPPVMDTEVDTDEQVSETQPDPVNGSPEDNQTEVTTEEKVEDGDDSEDKVEETTETENKVEAEEETEEKSESELDYKAAYEKLTRPFRANGRDIQVKDVDDAIALMQMGANYSKKMAALKPNLKLLKMLETSGLMSEEKISYLIDLQARNPAAISKLIKESGIDPLDLDESKAEGYRPTQRTVDDREIELDQVLEDIQGSPSYSRTLNVVSKEWDGASKQVIADSPQLLKVINSHMDSGIYDLIQKEMENERMYGRLSGLSDLEAYRQIGDAIQARGGFNHIGRDVNTAPPKQVAPQSKPSQEQVQKVKERKRAASTTTAAPTQQVSEFNPLSLSDEEFSKLVVPKYM